MTVLIPQPPRIDLAEITTDQTGKLRAKITRPWSMYFEAIFDRIGGNVASTPDDIEQGQLARVQDYVVSLETSLSMIYAESQRVASELDALRAQPNPEGPLASELDALLSQPTPSSLSLSLPSGQVPYGAGLGTTVASSANFTYDSATNVLSFGSVIGSALGMTVLPKFPTVSDVGGALGLQTPDAAKANTASGDIIVACGTGLGTGDGGELAMASGSSGAAGNGGDVVITPGAGAVANGSCLIRDSGFSTVVEVTRSGATPQLAFFGSTPRAIPAAYTLTYSTAVRTVPVATAAAVVTTAATLVAYGYTQAQADSIPVAINAMQADMLELKKLIVSLINDASVTSGLGLNAT